jgi:hypothetical protein
MLLANGDLAQSIVEQLGTQIDLIWTLSTAAIAAMLALQLQIVFHNREKDKKPIEIKASVLIYLAFLVQGLAVLVGYFARGALTNLTPAIYKAYDPAGVFTNFSQQTFGGSGTLRNLVLWQFVLFFFGVAVLCTFAFKNREILHSRLEKTSGADSHVD